MTYAVDWALKANYLSIYHLFERNYIPLLDDSALYRYMTHQKLTRDAKARVPVLVYNSCGRPDIDVSMVTTVPP